MNRSNKKSKKLAPILLSLCAMAPLTESYLTDRSWSKVDNLNYLENTPELAYADTKRSGTTTGGKNCVHEGVHQDDQIQRYENNEWEEQRQTNVRLNINPLENILRGGLQLLNMKPKPLSTTSSQSVPQSQTSQKSQKGTFKILKPCSQLKPFSPPSPPLPSPPVSTGSYTPIPNFASTPQSASILSFLKQSFPKVYPKLTLITASKQVVSGINYKLLFTINYSQFVNLEYYIVIYRNLKGQNKIMESDFVDLYPLDGKKWRFFVNGRDAPYFGDVQTLVKKEIGDKVRDWVLGDVEVQEPYFVFSYKKNGDKLKVTFIYDILKSNIKILETKQIKGQTPKPISQTSIPAIKPVDPIKYVDTPIIPVQVVKIQDPQINKPIEQVIVKPIKSAKIPIQNNKPFIIQPVQPVEQITRPVIKPSTSTPPPAPPFPLKPAETPSNTKPNPASSPSTPVKAVETKTSTQTQVQAQSGQIDLKPIQPKVIQAPKKNDNNSGDSGKIVVKPVQVPPKVVELPVKSVNIPITTVQIPVKPVPSKPIQIPVKPMEIPVKPIQIPIKPIQPTPIKKVDVLVKPIEVSIPVKAIQHQTKPIQIQILPKPKPIQIPVLVKPVDVAIKSIQVLPIKQLDIPPKHVQVPSKQAQIPIKLLQTPVVKPADIPIKKVQLPVKSVDTVTVIETVTKPLIQQQTDTQLKSEQKIKIPSSSNLQKQSEHQSQSQSHSSSSSSSSSSSVSTSISTSASSSHSSAQSQASQNSNTNQESVIEIGHEGDVIDISDMGGTIDFSGDFANFDGLIIDQANLDTSSLPVKHSTTTIQQTKTTGQSNSNSNSKPINLPRVPQPIATNIPNANELQVGQTKAQSQSQSKETKHQISEQNQINFDANIEGGPFFEIGEDFIPIE